MDRQPSIDDTISAINAAFAPQMVDGRPAPSYAEEKARSAAQQAGRKADWESCLNYIYLRLREDAQNLAPDQIRKEIDKLSRNWSRNETRLLKKSKERPLGEGAEQPQPKANPGASGADHRYRALPQWRAAGSHHGGLGPVSRCQPATPLRFRTFFLSQEQYPLNAAPAEVGATRFARMAFVG
jgi:hypothetical protein